MDEDKKPNIEAYHLEKSEEPVATATNDISTENTSTNGSEIPQPGKTKRLSNEEVEKYIKDIRRAGIWTIIINFLKIGLVLALLVFIGLPKAVAGGGSSQIVSYAFRAIDLLISVVFIIFGYVIMRVNLDNILKIKKITKCLFISSIVLIAVSYGLGGTSGLLFILLTILLYQADVGAKKLATNKMEEVQ